MEDKKTKRKDTSTKKRPDPDYDLECYGKEIAEGIQLRYEQKGFETRIVRVGVAPAPFKSLKHKYRVDMWRPKGTKGKGRRHGGRLVTTSGKMKRQKRGSVI